MARTYYKTGSANAICDVCGLKYKLDELRKRWDGVWVCDADYEERHPQEFIRSKPDTNKMVIVKPRPPLVFVTMQCTIQGRSGVVGLATAGCSLVGSPYNGGFVPGYPQTAEVGYAIVGSVVVGTTQKYN